MLFAGKVVMAYSIVFFSLASMLVPLALSNPVNPKQRLVAVRCMVCNALHLAM